MLTYLLWKNIRISIVLSSFQIVYIHVLLKDILKCSVITGDMNPDLCLNTQAPPSPERERERDVYKSCQKPFGGKVST